MKKTWLRNILTIFFLAVFVFAAGNLFLIWQEYHQSDVIYEEAQTEFLQEEPEAPEEPVTWPTFTVDFDRLRATTDSVVAWIWMYDTVVSYPLMQGGNNDTYIDRSYDGTYNSSGSIFMDYRNARDFSDANTVIYGHNMRNGKMFATLKRFGRQDFYDGHKEFYILTPEGNRRYEIISAFQVDALSDIYDRNFASDEKRQAWFDKVLRRSAILAPVEASADDSFVTLSTCVSGNDYRARFVVIGRLAEIEPPYNEAEKTGATEQQEEETP